MDPLSALLLAGVLTGLLARTAGSAVTDVAAQVTGNTPPSLEKWRARQRHRAEHGQSRDPDPGPWKRRWRNSVQARNAKAAQKHQARMEYLRDHERGNIAAHKQRLQRRADRWDRVNDTAARWGSASWDAAKSTAARARDSYTERRAEKQAWKENARRDTDPAPEAEHDERVRLTAEAEVAGQPDGEQHGADVLTFTQRGEQLHVTADPDGESPGVRGDPADSSTWTGTDRYGGDIQTGIGESIEVTEPGGMPSVVHDSDLYALGDCLSPERRAVPQHQTETDDTEGTVTMSSPTHTGEITDLPSAQAYVSSASGYCEQIATTFETAQSQATTTAAELRAQLGHVETAQASLAGQGLDSEAARLATVAEQFTALAQAMDQVEGLLSATQDQLGAAANTLAESAREFQSQQGIAEQVQSHQSVADNTAFYANA